MSALPDSGLLERAFDGDREAFGVLLERYRPYLRILARRWLDSDIDARVAPSDAVQQTCLEAYRDLPSFRGKNTNELLAWLRRILENNVSQAVHTHILAQKRSVTREAQPYHADGNHRNLSVVVGSQSSPSARAMRGELAARLAKEIESLSEDQCEAIRLRYLEGWPLARLSDRFQRSESAVAGLLKRGLQNLRRRLTDLGGVE